MSPDKTTAESELLVAYLDAQRRHVLGILDGLDEDALRRPVLPSGWSCLGLVQHLALDVERFWFRSSPRRAPRRRPRAHRRPDLAGADLTHVTCADCPTLSRHRRRGPRARWRGTVESTLLKEVAKVGDPTQASSAETCPDCRALVADLEAHSRWHSRLVADLANAVENEIKRSSASAG